MTGLPVNMCMALPEMILLLTALIALIGDLWLRKYHQHIAFFCCLIGLGITGIINYSYIGQYAVVIFSGQFISDDLAQLMKLFICISVFLSFLYSRHYVDEHKMPNGDYYVLGILSTIGMMILVSAHSLISIYLGLELLSLPLYAMTAFCRYDSDATEAAMKFFVMGSIASAMLLYGMSLIYAATGQLDLADLSRVILQTQVDKSGLLAFAMVFLLAGVGFKLAAMPFHMWAPDVYEGAPSAVTLFLSAAPKIAALGMAFRLFTFGLSDIAFQWQQVMLVMALLSAFFGNLFAIAQTEIKRLLAYSTIANMGYALFGLLTTETSGYAASLYYILAYALMAVGAFGLVVLLSKSGTEIRKISDLKGLSQRNPWIAFMMLLIMFSMAGVPPLVGFFTKLLVLKALVDNHMTFVAILGLVFTVIGAVYYLRIVKIMYFDDAIDTAKIQLSRGIMLVFSANCLSLLFLGIFPNELMSVCVNAF